MAFLNSLGGDDALPPGFGPSVDIPEMAMPDSGIMEAVARNRELSLQRRQQMQQPHKRGWLGNALGILGDALLVGNGAEPMYRKSQEKERRNAALANYLDDPQGALRALFAAGDPETAIEIMKAQRGAEPPSFVQEYQYRQRLSPEERAEYDKYAEMRKFNPFGAPVVLQPGDVYEPGGSEGEYTATGPNGEKVRFNPQSGQWEPMGGPTAPPSVPFP